MKKNEKQNKEVAPALSGNFLSSFGEFDQYFEDFLSRKWPRLFDWSSLEVDKQFPKVDVIDHDNDIEVKAALPGVKKDEIDVDINHQTITIQTSTKREKKEKDRYYRREITEGEYQRTLPFPGDVDYDNAKATFKDGILSVKIPKSEKSKLKNKKLEIK